MSAVDVTLTGSVFAFLLVFARVGGVVMVLPGFANPGPPAMVRLAFALMLSFLLMPSVFAEGAPVRATAFGASLLLIGEVIIGLAIGSLVRLLMGALSMAGQIIALQTSLAMAMNFDPSQNQQGALFSTFLTLVAVTLIFVTNLHHGFLLAIAGSYGVFTPGAPLPTGDFAELAIDLSAQAVVVAVQMSAPLLVFGLVFYFGVGVISRLMPQANMFFTAMPLTVLAGLVIFAATLGGSMMVFHDALSSFVAALA